MNNQKAEQFRRELLVRRDALRHRWRRELSEEDELIQEQIDALERSALARIQSALSRIERGSYGECVVCHEPIGAERLGAIPDTDRCGGCAPMVN